MSQTRDQMRFSVSEVAADWHELMMQQRIMRPYLRTNHPYKVSGPLPHA